MQTTTNDMSISEEEARFLEAGLEHAYACCAEDADHALRRLDREVQKAAMRKLHVDTYALILWRHWCNKLKAMRDRFLAGHTASIQRLACLLVTLCWRGTSKTATTASVFQSLRIPVCLCCRTRAP